MTTIRGLVGVLAVVLSTVLAPEALAQATRTWVSGVGDDVNPCSRTAPCKTFAGAISKTAANGIIMVLDPGGFGAVTIVKSITIDGSGGSNAGILATGGSNGINVNGAGVTVVLRNLSIEGLGTGLNGINFVQGSRLLVEKCQIYGFRAANGTGIKVTAPAVVTVKDSTIHDNGINVSLAASANGLIATLDNVLIEDAVGAGVSISGGSFSFLNILRSTINSNGGAGVLGNGSLSFTNLVDNTIAFNGGVGVSAAVSGATVRISRNTIVNNNGQLTIAAGATMASDGTNNVVPAGAAPNATFTHQ